MYVYVPAQFETVHFLITVLALASNLSSFSCFVARYDNHCLCVMLSGFSFMLFVSCLSFRFAFLVLTIYYFICDYVLSNHFLLIVLSSLCVVSLYTLNIFKYIRAIFLILRLVFRLYLTGLANAFLLIYLSFFYPLYTLRF